MIAYIDSSALLRTILKEPKQFREWKKIKSAYSSQLLEIECYRVIDRLRLSGNISDQEVVVLRSVTAASLKTIGLVQFDSRVAKRACGAFPTVVGTLDALHLSTALLVQESLGKQILFLSFDEQLNTAAQASGFETLGCEAN